MNKHNTQSDDWKKVVIQLREVAEAKKMTQEELSDKTGMLQSSISRVFSLSFAPRLSTVMLIAKALEVNLVISDEIKDEFE